jgi:glycosyltransferase involved in cell wall biosynthesis
MKRCVVSVVITNHKKGILVRRAVESAIPQLRTGDELVLFDDASDDDITQAVFGEVSGTRVATVYAKSERRLGAAGAKNSAVGLSTRPYVILLDADDVLPPGSISKIKSAFRSNPDAAIVFGDYFEKREEENERGLVSVSSLADSAGWLDASRLASRWELLGSSPFTRPTFEALGGFNRRYPVTDDVDFFRKAFVAGYRAKYVPYPIYQWNRSSSGNNASSTPKLVARSWLRNARFYRRFLPLRVFLGLLAQQVLTVLTGRQGDVDAFYRFVSRGRRGAI